MDTQQSHPLKQLVDIWLEKIRLAKKDKRAKFQDDADEAMSFFDNSGDWLDLNAKRSAIRGDASMDREKLLPPSFEMRVNKVAELRDLFGPALYHTNPVINVEPHDQVMVPPEALGIDPNAINQLGQQMMANPLLQQDPNAVQQMQMLQQQMAQYQQLSQKQQQDKVVNETRAELLRRALDYMQQETDKKSHARRSIDEALIMGAGVVWHEVDESNGGTKLVGSYYDSIKRLLIDPDARVFEDILWIARERVLPYWKLEDRWNLPHGSLRGKGSVESYDQEAERNNDPDSNDKKARGQTNDLIRHFELYSKMGMGGRLSKTSDSALDQGLRDQLEEFGDNCFLVLVNGVPYPLNLPSDVIESPMVEQPDGNEVFQFPQEIVTQDVPPVPDPVTGQPVQQEPQPVIDQDTGEPQSQLRSDVFLAFQWPIPFWADRSWPCEMLTYRDRPDEVWPMSIVKSGMGELRFINWVMSFLAVKVRRCCHTTVGVDKAAGENIKTQLLCGADYNILEIEGALGKKLSEIVEFLQAPMFNPEIWTMLSQVFDLFDKRVGLTELIYGMTGNQLRTAAEANVKQQNLSIRPDDMANKTEDFLSKVARKEAMAMRWLLEGKDVQPYLGPVGAMVWDQQVLSTDIDAVVKEFRYRIEAGSARKPNKSTDIQNANSSMQVALPFIQQYSFATGDMGPANAVFQKWGKANDYQMPVFNPPPPPPPQGSTQQNPNQPQPKPAQAA